MEKEVIDSLAACLRSDIPAALVTITGTNGSSAGKTGDMMVVWSGSESRGTVGGGDLEFRAMSEAKKCLAAGVSREVSFALDEKSESEISCGGMTRMFIRVFNAGPRLIIVGGGHVGLELYHLGLHQGFSITVIDDRKEIADPDRFPEADILFSEDIAKTLAGYPITKEYCITIATRAHETDGQALEAVVGSDAGYVGMIGSSSKIKEVFKYLVEQGVSRAAIDRVYAPMGLNIATVKPKEIALSIFSEILLVKNSGSAEHMRAVKNISY